MSAPIFFCDQLLIRDGFLATSQKCCCYLIPCCSDCYFPVSNRTEDTPGFGLDGSQTGGRSQISDYTATFTQRGGGGIMYPGPDYVQTWVQTGPSSHAIRSALITDTANCAIYRLVSRCFWSIPVFSDSNYGPIGAGSLNVTYSEANGWYADPFTLELGNACSGTIAFSDTRDYYNDPPGVTTSNTFEGSFVATGGKRWPAGFTCNGDPERPGLYNEAEMRLAFDSDMPEGFL